MKVLVIYPTSQIGINLVRRLVREGHHVSMLCSEYTPVLRACFHDINSEMLTYHFHPISDIYFVPEIIRRYEPDWVFNLADYGSLAGQNDYAQMVEINIKGTTNVLDTLACHRGLRAYVHAGSGYEYGLSSNKWLCESNPVAPNTPYGATKAAATTLVCQKALTMNAQVVVLRFFSIYGDWDCPGRLIPTLIKTAKNNTLPPLSDPTSHRDFVYVHDAVDALITAAGTPLSIESNPIFNIASGEPTHLLKLVSLAVEILSIDAAPVWNTYKAKCQFDTKRTMRASPVKSGTVLGWTAKHELREGFQATANWFNELGSKYGLSFEGNTYEPI